MQWRYNCFKSAADAFYPGDGEVRCGIVLRVLLKGGKGRFGPFCRARRWKTDPHPRPSIRSPQPRNHATTQPRDHVRQRDVTLDRLDWMIRRQWAALQMAPAPDGADLQWCTVVYLCAAVCHEATGGPTAGASSEQ